MIRFLFAIVAVVSIDSAARWMTVPVLARGLRADSDQGILWHPVRTAESDATASVARNVQASEEEEFNQPVPVAVAGTEPTEPQMTYMKCLGTTTTTRACHFQNVYYDLDTKHFIYYGPAGTGPEMFGAPLQAGDPWLRLIRGIDNWKKPEEKRTQFFLDWRGGRPPPPANRVVDFAQPLHLRTPMHTRSFGHFLRDNLLPMIDLPLRFGRDPVDFDWVRWESKMGLTCWETESPVMEHYRALGNDRPSVTWQEVLDKALEGQSSSVRYVRFAEVIAGQGPVDIVTQSYVGTGVSETKLSQWAHMCDPYPFTEMRSIAYRNFGIPRIRTNKHLQVPSVSELEPFVLFLDGRHGEKRFMANADEILPKLKSKFPGVRMEHVEISKLTLEDQMELLTKATVVVSNIGSRSFRLIYLPNGATTILVGPPEYEVELEPEEPGGKPRKFTNTTPFFEIDACWAYIGYVNMLQYHVESEAEVSKPKPWTTTKLVRDTDIVLNEAKITALLEVALQTSEVNRPYTGLGTLSAYSS